MKKRIIWIAVALVALGLLGILWFHGRNIEINGQYYSRSAVELDLSGTQGVEVEKLMKLTGLKSLDLTDTGLTVQEYETLRQALPECRIYWSVPFQSDYISEETATLTVSSLSREDMDQLKYLPSLTTVDARGCGDLEQLMRLKEERPDLEVLYAVALNGEKYAGDIEELTLENADIEELKQMLPYLPQLNRVTFTGQIPENQRIGELKAAYPGVTFVWDFELFGVPVNSLDEELILSEIPMESVEPVEEALKYFYNLKRVEMCDCGIPSEEMDALWKRHPETRFVWTVKVGVCKLRTDVTVFMPYQFGYDGYSKLFDKHMAEMKYCVDLICLDMGHMGISDYSFLEYMPKMKYLILGGTKGTDFSALAYLKELVFLELFMTQFDQAEVLTGLTKLEDLNIGNSAVDNVEPLKEMTWLKRLWLPGARNVWRVEREALQEALPDTIVNFKGVGSTDEGWRESPNYYAMRDLLGMGYMSGYVN